MYRNDIISNNLLYFPKFFLEFKLNHNLTFLQKYDTLPFYSILENTENSILYKCNLCARCLNVVNE